MTEKKIVIGVATFGRSEYLKFCLESLCNLMLPENFEVEFILVDNNPEPQVELILSAFDFPYPVHCFHEEERGIVHARNRILDEAVAFNADFLAFLDDDEMADAYWLTQATSSLSDDISIVTGPCLSLFEQPKKWLSYSRVFTAKNVDTGDYAGTASTRNVLFDMKIVTEQNLRFEEALNWVGGSDTYFFIQARKAGYRTHWNNEMPVLERIPETRSNFKWILKRNLRFGGGRVHRERLQKPNAVVAIREFFVGIWFILKGILESLLLFWLDHHFLRGIERTTRGFGIFYALFGFHYKEYKSHHGH
ncbi:MAG: glycosyltransferase family 2 protein [Cytophagales bacterium]|nr:glycosyltransferase family 2 protein [Cytophagales bacterium]